MLFLVTLPLTPTIFKGGGGGRTNLLPDDDDDNDDDRGGGGGKPMPLLLLDDGGGGGGSRPIPAPLRGLEEERSLSSPTDSETFVSSISTASLSAATTAFAASS